MEKPSAIGEDDQRVGLRPTSSASLPCTIVLKPVSLALSASVFSCNSHRSLETGLSAPRPSEETRPLSLETYLTKGLNINLPTCSSDG